jgi:hypothetical protein
MANADPDANIIRFAYVIGEAFKSDALIRLVLG